MTDERHPMTVRTAAALLALAVAPLRAQSPVDDSIVGKWYGVAGLPQDRVELGFEFRRNAKGDIKAYLYNPVANFYGLELPGTVQRDSGRFVNNEPFPSLSFVFTNGRLEGTYFPTKLPISLGRVASLPAEVPVPAFPAGRGPKWQVKLGGAIYATAAARGGIAYVGTTAGVFYAVSLADGTVAWAFPAGRPMFGEPLATEDAVFFACDNGKLYKLERNTGKELWSYDLGDAGATRILPHAVISDFDFDYRSPRPVLAGGILYIGAGDGSFHAVNAAHGRREWRFQTGDRIRANAVIDGPRVIFGSWDHFVYAIDRGTGEKLWQKDTRARVTSSPAIVGTALITGNRGGVLQALNPLTGETKWRMLFWGSSVESEAVPAAGRFYIGSSDLRRVSYIDADDGRVIWRTDVYGWAWGTPAVTDSLVIIGAAGASPYQMRHLGSLVALDRASGKIAWRWPMAEWPGSFLNGFVASPTIANGSVIIGGLDGTLYSFAP
ncbi:MAG TPA: PQQ-binding-like beta-propeller repeat protein [Gemmatimonadaceae bacterium]|nr:PQQ-binding-like beta-propeller repeat protein [Gemmatimonadaceae bacterium]